MPRSREAEMPQQQQQRPSPRVPLHLKVTSSESIGLLAHHHRGGGSPRREENHRRSPRSPLHELPAGNQKNRGTRVADLETKLGHAKEEMRKLKQQLASAEAAKRDAQHELEETKKMIPAAPQAVAVGEPAEEKEEHPGSPLVHEETQEEGDGEPPVGAPPPPHVEEGDLQVEPVEGDGKTDDLAEEVIGDGNTTDALVEEVAKEEVIGDGNTTDALVEEVAKEVAKEEVIGDGNTDALVEEVAKEEVMEATQLPESQENAEETPEEAEPAEDAEALGLCLAENAVLRRQLADAEACAAAARAREAETTQKLAVAGEQLGEATAAAGRLREELASAEGARAALESEMRRMRVQTEQWRKAAEEAAGVLAAGGGGAGGEADGLRVAARCGSMDKHLVGSVGGFGGGLWSPLAGVEAEEGMAAGRRRGGGIRVWGDLWKKKGGQQQQHHHKKNKNKI